MPRRARMLAALPVAILLALPSVAHAGSAFDEVFKNFEQNGGAINPCTLSDATLKAALGQIPNDLQQYAPDIQHAIKLALAARASGACNHVTQTAPVAPPPPVVTTTTTPAPPTGGQTVAPPKPVYRVQVPPSPPASIHATSDTGTVYPAETVAAHTSAGPPATLVILGTLALLLALLAGSLFGARALGLEPRWSLGMRHAFAEAGYRTAGVWAEFTDWVRFGR